MNICAGCGKWNQPDAHKISCTEDVLLGLSSGLRKQTQIAADLSHQMFVERLGIIDHVEAKYCGESCDHPTCIEVCGDLRKQNADLTKAYEKLFVKNTDLVAANMILHEKIENHICSFKNEEKEDHKALIFMSLQEFMLLKHPNNPEYHKNHFSSEHWVEYYNCAKASYEKYGDKGPPVGAYVRTLPSPVSGKRIFNGTSTNDPTYFHLGDPNFHNNGLMVPCATWWMHFREADKNENAIFINAYGRIF